MQIEKIELILSNSYYSDLLNELESDDSLSFKLFSTIDEIKEIVSDADGAGIEQECLIYQYCVLVISNRKLFQKPFSPWLKNVLYSDAEAIDKIKDLEYFINLKNAK